jgi:hypothetical protein
MRYLKSFILCEGHRYQELEPLTNALSPARSGKPNGLTGWAYAARTRKQDLFLLYFEQDCPPATLTGARPNGRYRAQWFNPRTGQWRDATPEAITADAEGTLVLPPFPGTPARSDTDWALKLASPEGAASPPKPQTVRVAGIVLKWLRGDKAANYRRIEPLIREAAAHGAQIVCTTECFLGSICPSGGMFGPKSNDSILQARSKENGKWIVFVHPAEFLVTGPDGTIVERTLLGDKLVIMPDQIGTDADSQRVCHFDVPRRP